MCAVSKRPWTKMKRIILCWLTVLASLLVASLASAASGKQGVALLVEGADVDIARREIIESIPQGAEADGSVRRALGAIEAGRPRGRAGNPRRAHRARAGRADDRGEHRGCA